MTRFQPTRAGIINMWDYRDEEFCFADGWLVLRGPNGSGKTKALEVLFPFVLDGRIDPKRLNPFAAEDRTMKSNLLFRGGENAVGYVWLRTELRKLVEDFGAGMAEKQAADPGRLLTEAVALLASVGLVARVDGGVLVLPLLARYRSVTAQIKNPPPVTY